MDKINRIISRNSLGTRNDADVMVTEQEMGRRRFGERNDNVVLKLVRDIIFFVK